MAVALETFRALKRHAVVDALLYHSVCRAVRNEVKYHAPPARFNLVALLNKVSEDTHEATLKTVLEHVDGEPTRAGEVCVGVLKRASQDPSAAVQRFAVEVVSRLQKSCPDVGTHVRAYLEEKFSGIAEVSAAPVPSPENDYSAFCDADKLRKRAVNFCRLSGLLQSANAVPAVFIKERAAQLATLADGASGSGAELVVDCLEAIAQSCPRGMAALAKGVGAAHENGSSILQFKVARLMETAAKAASKR